MSGVRRLATKPFVVMPVIALLVLGGWWAWTSRTGDETVASASSSQLVAATTGTMSRTVSAEGTVAVADSEDLSFSASGTVTAVNVTAGQAVKAGDVLATIDSAELEAAVADAETSLAEARSKQYDNYVAGASATQQVADQTQVTTAEDRLASANEDLAGAQLVASFDGTVSTVDLTVGEELGAGGTGATSQTGTATGSGQTSSDLGSSSSTGGLVPGGLTTGSTTGSTDSSSTAQIQVVTTGSFIVELGLDDTAIADVAVGQTATVALATSTSSSGFPGGGAFAGGGGGFPSGGGFPAGGGGGATTNSGDDGGTSSPLVSGGSSATGTVTEVGAVADASSGVATYPVTVSFTDTTGEFNAGATVQVDITYAQVDDVVQVPAFAVTTSGGTSKVTVSIDGEEQERTVETGLTSGTMVEITSGLSEGEQVVVAVRGGGQGGGPPGGGQIPQGFPGGAVGTPGAATQAGS